MSNFSIGEQVVCVKGSISRDGVKLVENETYTVKNTNTCCTDGVFVGLMSIYTTECDCGYNFGGGEWWHGSSLFVSLEEYEELNEAVESMKDVLAPKVLV